MREQSSHLEISRGGAEGAERKMHFSQTSAISAPPRDTPAFRCRTLVFQANRLFPHQFSQNVRGVTVSAGKQDHIRIDRVEYESLAGSQAVGSSRRVIDDEGLAGPGVPIADRGAGLYGYFQRWV